MTINPFQFEDRQTEKTVLYALCTFYCAAFHFSVVISRFHQCAFLCLCSLLRGNSLGNTIGRFIIYFLDQPCMLLLPGLILELADLMTPQGLFSLMLYSL